MDLRQVESPRGHRDGGDGAARRRRGELDVDLGLLEGPERLADANKLAAEIGVVGGEVREQRQRGKAGLRPRARKLKGAVGREGDSGRFEGPVPLRG